jgi:hypothetical protein
VYTLSDEAITYGNAKNEQAMFIAEQCEATQTWVPFNQSGLVTVDATDL